MVYIHRKEGGEIYGKQNNVCSNHQRHGLSKFDIVINKIMDYYSSVILFILKLKIKLPKAAEQSEPRWNRP